MSERTFTECETLRLAFMVLLYERTSHYRIMLEAELEESWKNIYVKVSTGKLLEGTDCQAGDAFALCYQCCRLPPDNYETHRNKFFKGGGKVNLLKYPRIWFPILLRWAKDSVTLLILCVCIVSAFSGCVILCLTNSAPLGFLVAGLTGACSILSILLTLTLVSEVK